MGFPSFFQAFLPLKAFFAGKCGKYQKKVKDTSHLFLSYKCVCRDGYVRRSKSKCAAMYIPPYSSQTRKVIKTTLNTPGKTTSTTAVMTTRNTTLSSTTLSSTTERSTKKSTTLSSTTLSSTTERSTKKSTTLSSTTERSTKKSTTLSSTTERSTKKITTLSSTTLSSTTLSSTTERSTKKSTTLSSTTLSSTTETSTKKSTRKPTWTTAPHTTIIIPPWFPTNEDAKLTTINGYQAGGIIFEENQIWSTFEPSNYLRMAEFVTPKTTTPSTSIHIMNLPVTTNTMTTPFMGHWKILVSGVL